MSYFIKGSGAAEDYRVKSQRLCIPFAIVASATPANKTNSNALSGNMALDLQGQLAADAIDSGCNFTTPNDASGVFGVLLYGLGSIYSIPRVSVDMLSSGTATVALEGASNTGITASGNMAVSVTWSGNLSTTNLNATYSIDYVLKSN